MKSIKQEIKQNRSFQNPYQEATINLIYTGKWMVKLHNDVFQAHGISLQQYNILRILKGSKSKAVTVKYIKERMLDKMSDTSRIVDNMVKKKFLDRVPNSLDRRKVDITISKLGKKLLKDIDKEQEILFGYLDNLSEEEIVMFNKLLNKARG